MEPNLDQWIFSHQKKLVDPAGREIIFLDDPAARRIADGTGNSLGAVFRAALDRKVWPQRYIRNHDSLSVEDQRRLAGSVAAVIGAGGLGGTVILLLARMGIGALTVVDSDVFDESNLNRQAVSTTGSIGKSKAEEAVAMVRQINPAVEVRCRPIAFDGHSASAILENVDVVVDALDNVPDRLELGKAARRRGIPLVHGAIAGFQGRVMTIFPDDPGLEALYGEDPRRGDPRRPEAVLGVPTITPSMVATLQAMEVVKILLRRGETLRRTMLHVDLEQSRFEAFQL